MEKVEKHWVPPEVKEIKVKDLVQAIRGAIQGNPKKALDILKGLDKPEWYPHIIRLYTSTHHLITPVKIGETWSSLEIRVTEAEPVVDYSDEPFLRHEAEDTEAFFDGS